MSVNYQKTEMISSCTRQCNYQITKSLYKHLNSYRYINIIYYHKLFELLTRRKLCDPYIETMNSDTGESKTKTDVLSKVNMSKVDNTSKTNVHKVTKTIVTSPDIYKPVGPYSQAILADKTLYVSGVLGLDAEAQMVCGGAEAQARQALENLRHVLEAGGASLESVVKTTILLGNMEDFKIVNQVYAEFFPKDCPARATYQVAKLPLDAAVEIEAIALSGDLVVSEAGPCPCARS